jgi:uncharacterized protein (TIGR00725 family)
MQIAVIGASEPSKEAYKLAEEVGMELGERGVVTVTGGLGGIMEAACKGAKRAGGITIGILPGSDPSDANRYVDSTICTGIGYASNIIVAKSGMAAMAVAGALGTLSEIAHALGDDIPVIGINTWSIFRDSDETQPIVYADNPIDAVDKAIDAASRRSGIYSYDTRRRFE